MKDIDDLLAHLRRRIVGTALAVMALVFLAMLFFSRSISGPVREFVTASRKVAGGDFEAKVSLRNKGEFADFARSFNTMTADLKSMFATCEERREELDSILSSIQDGLLRHRPGRPDHPHQREVPDGRRRAGSRRPVLLGGRPGDAVHRARPEGQRGPDQGLRRGRAEGPVLPLRRGVPAFAGARRRHHPRPQRDPRRRADEEGPRPQRLA